MATEQTIDPYNVSGGVDEQGNAKAIDYDRLIEEFGTQRLTPEHITRFEKVTGRKAPKLMRRGLFFSHRDFDKALDYYEKYGTFMLYTGRGPSSGSVHLGHTIPFLMTKELQEIFDVPLVIMLTDDEKYLHAMDKNSGVRKEGSSPEDFMEYAEENIKDIIALGFDVKKTFIFSDFEFMGGHFWRNTIEFSGLISNNQVRGAFGFTGETNIGKNFYGAEQCIAAFPSSYPALFGLPDYVRKRGKEGRRRHKALSKIPCLIPCAIDQEPYFRILRANSERMTDPHPKTSLILSKFLSGLQGPTSKMSASDPNSAIFMSDTPNEIKKKINASFSGGRETVEEQRKLGGNPDVDVAYAYLSYFLEDDAELEDIEKKYRSGEMLTGELKKRCIEELQKFVADFQTRRAGVTDDILNSFLEDRKLEYGGNPHPTHPGGEGQTDEESGAAPTTSNVAGTKLSDGNVISSGKSAEKKAAKLAKIAEQKAQKEREKLAREAEKLSLNDNKEI